jgi:hypothetical protein
MPTGCENPFGGGHTDNYRDSADVENKVACPIFFSDKKDGYPQII